MKLKNLVAAMAALSLTAGAMAAEQQQVADNHVIQHYLEGNSYESVVPHNYLHGKTDGFWLGAFGQISGAYNTDYLLMHRTYLPSNAGGGLRDNTLTFSIDNADLLFGYDSNNVGMFTDLGYSEFADYDKLDPSMISLHSSDLSVREAFATYQFNSMFAVKAGKFLSDYGTIDPYQPLQTLASAAYTNKPIEGAEGVFAVNRFHASVAAAADTTKNAPANSNNASPSVIVLNAGYQLPVAGGSLDLQGSYTNRTSIDPTILTDHDGEDAPAWLAGAHFATKQFSVSAHVQSLRFKELTYKPWVYDGDFNYIVNNKMTVGAYGNFVYNAPGYSMMHWVLGVTGGYSINHYVTANVYAQRVQVTSAARADGAANNITVMGALSFKV